MPNLNNLTYKGLAVAIGILGAVLFGVSSLLSIPLFTGLSILAIIAAGIVAAVGYFKSYFK